MHSIHTEYSDTCALLKMEGLFLLYNPRLSYVSTVSTHNSSFDRLFEDNHWSETFATTITL